MHPLLLAVCCTVTIHVHAPAGAAITGARVTLRGRQTYAGVTDGRGSATLQAGPGSYKLSASARGYDSVSAGVFVHGASSIDVALQPLDAPTLRTITTVTVDGRLAPIEDAIPSVYVTRQSMDALGESRAVDALMALPSATFTRPDGGAASAIDVVSLRGPDPSESLVTLDGQSLNDGNTGDLDLSRFPAAAFSGIDVTEGLGAEDTSGSNTFGGAINFISLEPTQAPHYTFSASGGSFGRSEAFVNATGTQDRLGYAAALDDQNEAGYVNQPETVYTAGITPGCPQNCGTPAVLGSSVASRLALADMTWTFSQNANISARVFTLGDNRDQSSAVNGIDDTPGSPTYGLFVGPGEQTFAQNVRAYQVRGQAPLGSGELLASLSESDDGVTVNGGSYSPYDVTHVDHRYDGEAGWQRTFASSQFAIGGYTRYESLFLPGSTIPGLGQTIDVFYARGGFEPAAKLRLDAGVFESLYTSFGSNLDGRLGAVYNLDPKTALRFSIGTGFRAPLLIERYQFPLADLQQDQYGVYLGQGNENERPEHATEYELGISHQFASSTLDFSLYQTNLRDPIEIYYPVAAIPSAQNGFTTPCLNGVLPASSCVSYNSNVGNAVYQGLEARYVQSLRPQHLFLTAMYGLNVAYPKDLSAYFSNPTSGGNLVDYRQFPGIPQQEGSLQLTYALVPWHAAVQWVFRGTNNELNAGPFSIVDAAVGYHVTKTSDLTLSGTNLFGSVAGKFTRFGAGVPYLGVGGAELPTNALYIEPFGVRLIYTLNV